MNTPQLSHHHTRAADLELHWLEAGPPPGSAEAEAALDPVLFLHGWPTSSELWRNVLPVVGRTRRAIALDLPGFGRSDKPVDRRYGFRFNAGVLDAFLAALEIERVALCVHDIGGPIGLYWAAQSPQRVSQLALLNTLVFPELSWAAKAFVISTRLPGLRTFWSSPAGVVTTLRLGLSNRLSDEVAALYKAPVMDPSTGKDARQALLLSAQGLSPGGLKFIAESLPSFADIPVCLLYGERDRVLPDVAKTMARVHQILPHASVVALPGCGHFLQEDQPERVADELGRFFG